MTVIYACITIINYDACKIIAGLCPAIFKLHLRVGLGMTLRQPLKIENHYYELWSKGKYIASNNIS